MQSFDDAEGVLHSIEPRPLEGRGMSVVPDSPFENSAWESVHVCPNCGHVINLAELDLRAITTGIVTCPSCDWSGQIEIQVVDQVPRKKPTSVHP